MIWPLVRLTHYKRYETIKFRLPMEEEIQSKPTNKPAFFLIVIFVVLIGALLLFLFLKNRSGTSSTTKTSNAKITTSQAQVNVTGQGFIPTVIEVKKGTQITWTNTDTSPHQIASDPHPTHTLLAVLNSPEPLASGDSFSATLEKSGTFTYHDHLNPLKFKGTIIVK